MVWVVGIASIVGATGRVYFWLAEHNTKPYNIGIPLWTDILLMYVMSRRANGDAVPKGLGADGADGR